MRIAVLTNAYPPKAQGGAGRIALEYTEILKGLGHEVRVWVPSGEFNALNRISPLARLIFHLRDLAVWREVADEIRAWKPDVLFTHNLTGCGFATPKIIQTDGVRWFHVLHDVQLFEPSGQIISGEPFRVAKKIWRGAWGSMRRSSLGTPDIVISPTEWLLDEHVKRGFFIKARKEIVPNPIRHPGQCVGGGNGPLLFVGRLDRDKGIDLLLEAWPKLKEVAGELVVVGGGGRLERLREKFIDVEFKGQLAVEDVMAVMARSGALILPSLVMENQPTVILEALACGCRVVASDVGGVKETLGLAGWVFKPGSIEGLASAVKDALSNGFDRGRQRAAQEILKLHEPDAVASRLAGLLKSIL